jgi:hypothetical protein
MIDRQTGVQALVDERQLRVLAGADLAAAGQTTAISLCALGGTVYVYKRYIPSITAARPGDRLSRLVHWRLDLQPADRQQLDERTAWVRHVVRRDGETVGVLVPPAPNQFWRVTAERKPKPRQFDLLVRPDGERSRSRGWEFLSVPQTVARLGHLLETLIFLHQRNVVVGDLQGGNILVSNLTGVPSTFLIDCDSVLLGGEWTLPASELQVLRRNDPEEDWPPVLNQRTDLYKFARLAAWATGKNMAAVKLGPSVLGVMTETHSATLRKLLEAPLDQRLPSAELRSMAMLWTRYVSPSGRETVRTPDDLRAVPWEGARSRMPASPDDSAAIVDAVLRPQLVPRQATLGR